MFDSFGWVSWGAILLLVFPMLVLLLGELGGDRRDQESRGRASISILRNGVLPLAFVDILLRQVAGFPSDQLLVKIVDTGLSVVGINAGVALLNALFFGGGVVVASRARIPGLLLDLVRAFFVVCGAAIVTSRIWDIDLSSLITALGVGSLVIGLALQDTLGSLFAGIALVSARQFAVGDSIRFGNDEGVVKSMNWRSVAIQTPTGDLALVPNSVIGRESVTVLAKGAGSTAQVIQFLFPYDVSPDQVSALVAETARETRHFHADPPPVARIAALEDSSIRYAVLARVVDPQNAGVVRGEFLSNLWFATRRAGLAFAGERPRPEALMDEAAERRLLATRLAAAGVAVGDTEALEALLRDARLQLYRAGQPIVPRGAVVQVVHVVLNGRVRIVVGVDSQEVRAREFGRGQFLLAKAFLRGVASPSELRAVTEVETVAIPIADFREFAAMRSEFLRNVEQDLIAAEVGWDDTLEAEDSAAFGDRARLLHNVFAS